MRESSPTMGPDEARADWPPGGGEMGARIRAFDWASTPLGAIAGWPTSLRTLVDLMLASRHPIYIAWGPALTSLFNDGYLPIVGAKHPGALGLSYWELWSEISADYRPLVESVLAGEGQLFIDAPFPLAGREGVPMSWFTFSWTPIRDDGGRVAGFFCVAIETTAKVLGEARLQEREAALQQARAELEQRVAERTAELARLNARLHAEALERQRAEAERAALQRRLTTAQEDERKRISRDLHDQTGQLLASLAIAVRAAADVGPLPSSVAGRLAEVQRVADELGRQVHELAVRLRPTTLDDLGLSTALRELVDGWSSRTGVPVDLQTVGVEPGRLPAEVETALYRVVQEALTNVAKHAAARQVSVVVHRQDVHVTAVIEDDGLGFDPSATPRGRLGLVSMRERLELIGGRLDLESTLGVGTTVIARAPSSLVSLRPPTGR